MRAAAVIATAFVLLATPAMACTIIPTTLPDGSWEKPEAWYRRTKLAAQKQAWRDADYVFVAQVRSQRLVSDYRIDAGLRPIGVLKGRSGDTTRFGSFDPGWGNTCGPDYLYPDIGEFGVFYAHRAPWWRRWLPWARMEITFAVPVRDVFDPRIPVEMRAAAARLRKSRNQ